MTGALSPTHWVIILVVVLLVFGGKRLPDAARGLGRSLRIFKAETASLTKNGATHDGDDSTAPAEEGAGPAAAPAAASSTSTSAGSSTSERAA